MKNLIKLNLHIYVLDSSKTYNNIEISIDKIGIDIYLKLNLDRSCNSLVGGSKDDWTTY